MVHYLSSAPSQHMGSYIDEQGYELSYYKNKITGRSLEAQQVKDPTLSLLWLGLPPWVRSLGLEVQYAVVWQ